MDCMQILDVAPPWSFEWTAFCATGGVGAGPPAATVQGWTVAAVIVAAIAALIALFKDELWWRVHAPKLEVRLVRAGVVAGFELELRVRNTSKRMAADEVTVRAVELEPHPLEGAIGMRGVSHIVPVDRLVPRASGETSYGVAPQAEVRLPFVTWLDGQTRADPVLASVAWAPKTSVAQTQIYDEAGGLLVLPSADDRAHWVEMHPNLVAIMSAPAMIRLEVAARNVPARLYTVKLRRTPDAPVADDLPLNLNRRVGVFSSELVEGSEPYNRVTHASSLPIGRTVSVERAESDAGERAGNESAR
jgi:hypothetical protein